MEVVLNIVLLVLHGMAIGVIAAVTSYHLIKRFLYPLLLMEANMCKCDKCNCKNCDC